MINNAFPYRFMADLILNSDSLPLPVFLKDVLKKNNIPNVEKLEDFFHNEIQNASLQTLGAGQYFLYIARETILCHLFKRNHQKFHQSVDIVKHRLGVLRNVPDVDIDVNAWDHYLDLLTVAFTRLTKNCPIEDFEQHINKLDWSSFDETFISSISSIIGLVYANEIEAEQHIKARIWFQKSMSERDYEENLDNFIFLTSYFSQNNPGKVSDIIDQFKAGIDDLEPAALRALFQHAAFELDAFQVAHQINNFDDPETRLEFGQQQLRELELRYNQETNLPVFTKANIELSIAQLYNQLFNITDDDLEQANFAKFSLRYIDNAIEMAETSKDVARTQLYRIHRINFLVSTGSSVPEKDGKELVFYYKKSHDYPSYMNAVTAFSNLLITNDNAQKTYDVIQDVFKFANKRIEEGGFFLIVEGMKLANKIFLREAQQPGVSWMVHILDNFFERIVKVIEAIDENLDQIGKSQIELFRNTYIELEPATHFNVKTYLRYQLYEVKMMRVGAIINDDPISLRIADKLIHELEDDNNPLSFIKTDWEDYKKVPNSVRNRTLNKCINISKGDLPLAAEHLDFSYRNLRSYITFKEVNRLGFFLDMQQTNNRQLEQGIRLMFYDLYKRGTIFEVVFDMPKFLVTFANTGFYSQDLERSLNIKGTTAKKYIKIMMEIKLIRQDKTTGRKHYYRLIRENVMNRLGKDQATLIQ